MSMFLESKKFKYGVVLSLIFSLFLSFSVGSFASAQETMTKEDVEKLARAIYESSTYQEETRTFTFDEEKSISLGLDKTTAREMNIHFSSLSGDSAEKVYKEQEKAMTDGVQPRVAPLVLWAAAALGAAGFSWLADKLLDYGAKKFCKAYKNSNKVTKGVCAVIAP